LKNSQLHRNRDLRDPFLRFRDIRDQVFKKETLGDLRDKVAALHWLPVRQQVVFKLATPTFKARKLGQPAYLANLLRVYQPTRNLRSSTADLLHPMTFYL